MGPLSELPRSPLGSFSELHKTSTIPFSKSPTDMSRSSSEYPHHDRSPVSDLDRSNPDPLSDPYRQRSPTDLAGDHSRLSSPASPTTKFGHPYDLPGDQKFLPVPNVEQKFHPVSFSEQKYHPGSTDDPKLSRVSPTSHQTHHEENRLPITTPADQQVPFPGILPCPRSNLPKLPSLVELPLTTSKASNNQPMARTLPIPTIMATKSLQHIRTSCNTRCSNRRRPFETFPKHGGQEM